MNRTDSFLRANSTTSLGTPSDGGSAWSALVGTWGIAADAGYVPGADPNALAVLDSASSDMDVQVTISSVSLLNDDGVVARCADASNFLLFRGLHASGWDLYQQVAGAFTALATGLGSPIATGDVAKLSCVGTTIKAYVNGVLLTTQSGITAGQSNTKHGLRFNNDAGARAGTFSITDAAGAAGGPFPSFLDNAMSGGFSYQGM